MPCLVDDERAAVGGASLLVEDAIRAGDLAVGPVVAQQVESVTLTLSKDAQTELRIAGDGERDGLFVVKGSDAVADLARARRCRCR